MPKLIIELHCFFKNNVTLTLENFDLVIKKIESRDRGGIFSIENEINP